MPLLPPPPRTATAVLHLLLVAVLLLLAAEATGDDEGATTSEQLVSAFLDPQNAARRDVGVRPLVWDEELAADARQRADYALRSRGCGGGQQAPPTGTGTTTGTGTGGEGTYGENSVFFKRFWKLARKLATAAAEAAVALWLGQKPGYDHASNTCRRSASLQVQEDPFAASACGGYTQVVWNTTTEVGCAVVFCSDLGVALLELEPPDAAAAVVVVCVYNPRGNLQGVLPY